MERERECKVEIELLGKRARAHVEQRRRRSNLVVPARETDFCSDNLLV